jgi:hypothetical protein
MVSLGQESKNACCFAQAEHSSPMEILPHKKTIWFASNVSDALPSPLLDPSWVQVNQTTKLFGTQGTLPTLNTKRGRGAC